MKTTVATIIAIFRPNDSMRGKPRRAPPNAPAWKVETMLAEMFCRGQERAPSARPQSLAQEEIRGTNIRLTLGQPVESKVSGERGQSDCRPAQKKSKVEVSEFDVRLDREQGGRVDEPDVGRVVTKETGPKRDGDGAQVDSCVARVSNYGARQGSALLSWEGVRKSGRRGRRTSKRPQAHQHQPSPCCQDNALRLDHPWPTNSQLELKCASPSAPLLTVACRQKRAPACRRANGKDNSLALLWSWPVFRRELPKHGAMRRERD